MTNTNKIPENVLIDEEDRERLEAMGKWCIHNGYCAKNVKGKYTMMHRIIIECPPGKQIDHINNNKLDNRKCNLRAVTNQENQFNRPTVKGYYLHKKSGKYMAYIMKDRHQHYLGLYETQAEARAAYLEAKKEMHKIGESV